MCAGERGGGGFAVGSGDADVLPLRNGAASSNSPITGIPARADRPEQIKIGRDARRDAPSDRRRSNDCVRLRFDRDPRARLPSVFHPPLAPSRLFRAAALRLRCRIRHADHHYFSSSRSMSLEYAHRSFNVVSANSAITRPAIQNRVMIFDSGHPRPRNDDGSAPS